MRTRSHRLADKVYAYDMIETPWSDTGLAGLKQKVVRIDRERGLFLGMLAFDPMTRIMVLPLSGHELLQLEEKLSADASQPPGAAPKSTTVSPVCGSAPITPYASSIFK